MKKIFLTEAQFKKICNRILKEENYTVKIPIGNFSNPEEAKQCSDYLNQNGFDTFAKYNEVIIYAEKDWMDPNYSQDTIEQAKQAIEQFNDKYRQVNESK